MLTAAVEGFTDQPVVTRIAESTGWEVHRFYGGRGKSQLDAALAGYNHAAQYSPWFVLRDLDRDQECAAEIVSALLPGAASQMVFRVAVRQVEAWLLADAQTLATFLRTPITAIPPDPESLPSAKRALVDVARHSRSMSVREAMIPLEGASTQVGPGYAGLVTQYAREHWRPDAAAEVSDSLERCVRRLIELRELLEN